MVLDQINEPNDIKKVNPDNYSELASDIRKFLVETTSKKGGHLASNLGVVELTMALHLSFDFPNDKVIWDVGHQAYTHKILSGRKNDFAKLREHDGISGFPKREESEFDVFNTGHSTTSVSAGMGLAAARDLKDDKNYVISVIGDGSITGGMAYEALNNIATIKDKFIVVLNDNNMSISESVGGMSKVLGDVRSSDSYYDLKANVTSTLKKLPMGDNIVKKIHNTKKSIKHLIVPDKMFEDMGLTYLGPIDGHDIDKLIKVFNIAKRIKRPVLVHVLTKKGFGYSHALNNPSAFHGVGAFDIKTGKPVENKEGRSYSQVFSDKICQLARADGKICAITAAMADGTGLKKFSKWFPERFYDVGIAEEHAVTFAGGLAAGGLKPVFAVYSSFLQRAYDQILHDVCLQKLPVVFAIDRAGVVGKDGNTHQGAFDLSYMSIIPGMTVIAPSCAQELELALDYAFKDGSGPVSVRYPRGIAKECADYSAPEYELGKAYVVKRGSKVALLAAGNILEQALEVADRLSAEGKEITVVDVRFVKPIDEALINELSQDHDVLVTLEENSINGGFGQMVNTYVSEQDLDVKVKCIALPDAYIEHGSVAELKKIYGIDSESIYDKVSKYFC